MSESFVFKKGKSNRRRQRVRENSSEDEGGKIEHSSKRLKGAIRVSSKPQQDGQTFDAVYQGTGQIRDKGDMGATRILEEETERQNDRRSQKEAFMKDGDKEEGKYTGMSGYRDWKQGLRREDKVPLHGPQRLSQFVRTTIRIDYQPDICKDYKETGFCSYGDSCKFLHDRGDYKAGWELDREWEEQQKAKRAKMEKRLEEGRDPDESSAESSDEEELPFACFTCRRNWGECETEPVRTECGHYFCEDCALSTHGNTARCPVCEKRTNGIFNVADDIVAKYKLMSGKRRRRNINTSGWGGWAEEVGGDTSTGGPG